jgi:hypothetical protein
MNNHEISQCDELFEYLTEECTDMQRKRFEKHLASCKACMEEATVWRETWNRLGDDTPQLDLPEDLKPVVLGSIFADDQLKKDSTIRSRRSGYRSYLRWAAALSVLILTFLGGWLVRGNVNIEADPVQALAQSDSIEALFRLTADRETGKFDDYPRAYGVACLVRSENTEQLVVYVFGTPQTQGGEAYQVWLLDQGKRTSAGTFTVDKSGIGIMTLPLPDGPPTFQAVGVTLEPDPHSTAPRGPKMFGSEEQAAPKNA